MRNVIEWLREAREKHSWDLADICLAQCEGPVGQFCDGGGEEFVGEREGDGEGLLDQAGGEATRGIEGLDPGIFGLGFNGGVHTGPSVIDTQNSVNGFEYPWADLWDLF